MTSITMSKSPKHFVRDLLPDARARDTDVDLQGVPATRVHKQILHLPIRTVPHGPASLSHAPAREET